MPGSRQRPNQRQRPGSHGRSGPRQVMLVLHQADVVHQRGGMPGARQAPHGRDTPTVRHRQ
eukprot:10222043-Alexandrium_andersonii.AAC.1